MEFVDNHKSIENLYSQVKLLEEKDIDWDSRCTCAEKSLEVLVAEVELLNAKVRASTW